MTMVMMMEIILRQRVREHGANFTRCINGIDRNDAHNMTTIQIPVLEPLSYNKTPKKS